VQQPPNYPPEDQEDNTIPAQPMPVDPALAEGALARIRKQVQGNGMRPSSVELRNVTGHVYTFFGTTSVRLEPKVQEGKRAGRFTDGQIIQPEQITAAIQEFISRVASDRGVLALVHETVLSRPDHGFGVSGESIPLPQVARNFVAHEACGACRGVGGTPCHNCHGQMRVTCYRCHGQGGIPCVTCSGRGQILTPQGPIVCHACAGRGLSACPVCYGQRLINCPECQAQGKKICEACSGHGWTTRSWAVTLGAETIFHLRTKGLPPGLVGLIERVGAARISADRHAKVTFLSGRDAEAHIGEAEIQGESSLWFLYRAEMPFAELEIAMGKTVIKPKLAGYKARMVDVPDFMDALLRAGAEHLSDAAQGGAGAAQMVLAASRYRALGDILRALVRTTPKRAYKNLMDSYPLGLSENFARGLLKDANTAMSRLSLWPRTVAMAVALVAAFGVLAGFYIYGGRTYVADALSQNGWPGFIAWFSDILLIILLGLGGMHIIRLSAQRALHTVMEGLGIMAGGRLPLPKPGAPGLWLWLGVIVMAATFAFISGLFLR
jgi:hypothetical protein